MLSHFHAIGDQCLINFRSRPYEIASNYRFLQNIYPYATARMYKNVTVDQSKGKIVLQVLFDILTIPNIFAN